MESQKKTNWNFVTASATEGILKPEVHECYHMCVIAFHVCPTLFLHRSPNIVYM